MSPAEREIYRTRKRKNWRDCTDGRSAFARQLKKLYNLDVEDYARMFEAQNGLCAIGKESLNSDGDCHMDHNHRTGQLRALLCRKCNVMIGMADDDQIKLAEAILYLRRFP